MRGEQFVRRLSTTIAVGAVLALAAVGCSPKGNDGTDVNPTSGIGQAQTALDPDAKGPAPEVAGARKGGVLTVYSQSTPNTFDPTDVYYTDSNEIGKLMWRTPTQIALRNGKAVLVPDLTDLGTVSADGLTWTFKMKGTFKYEDGSEVKVEDLAYSIKRSFAHDLFGNGPTYQLDYFKDGDTYKGPWASGDSYSGVETQGTDTLVIHLRQAFPDLPWYMTFPMFTPIPKAKDTKDNYKNKWISTGPYMLDTYTAGTQLKLKKNPNWDGASDPVRHQYVDGWDFKWGVEDVANQKQILASVGPDASAINYANIDASLIPDVSGEKKNQLLQGDSACTIVWQLDTRKIPLEVRKAIAKAFPYDQWYQAAGLNEYIAEPATTVMPPSVAGYKKYPAIPDLTGQGKGDPAEAKKMLEAAGKVGFELSWYYDNTKPVQQQINNVRKQAFEAAGFKVKDIGIGTAEVRTKKRNYDAPVNMGQTPAGWCSDWPTGSSWFPVLFPSRSVTNGTSWGMLNDKDLDAAIDAVNKLPSAEATAKWAEIDEKIMGMYVVIPLYYDKMAIVMGTNIGGAEGDGTMGMPYFNNMFLKS
ncbi:MAG: ABC transporter substrate-binding protein [Hamadaea sp.]|nr:ABC transporter substrate-binding protein [Hamadaea sp.]NUT05783.1 ABC transporter substrate-binding protein [Hamadaea sp.]